MLPKVANHLLLHTGRAVAAVQNQTGHTIRNVLQLQSSSTPGSGGAKFQSSSTPGSGGAKFHSGSQTYTGYTASDTARTAGNLSSVLHEVQKLRLSSPPHSTALYNAALSALREKRRAGDSLHPLLQTYNEMLDRSVLPNQRTYTIVISALAERDHECQKAIRDLEVRLQNCPPLDKVAAVADEKCIAQLRAENNFRSALTLFQAACSTPTNRIPLSVYNKLLRSCALHKNADAAVRIFAHLERRKDVHPTPQIFTRLISVYSNVGDLLGAKEVFEEFRDACHSNRITWMAENEDIEEGKDRDFHLRAAKMRVWNKMIATYIRCGQPTVAIGLLEQMLDTNAGHTFKSADVPPPGSSTFYRMIKAFCQSGDVTTALSWFDKLLEQDTSPRHPFEPTIIPSRPDYKTWVIMMDTLADEGMVDELNRLYSRLVELADQDGFLVGNSSRGAVLRANLVYLQSHPDLDDARIVSILDLLADAVHPHAYQMHFPVADEDLKPVSQILVQHYTEHGEVEKALSLAERYVDNQIRIIHPTAVGDSDTSNEAVVSARLKNLRSYAEAMSTRFLVELTEQLSLEQALRVARLSNRLETRLLPSVAPHFLRIYASSKARGDAITLSTEDWELMLLAAVQCQTGSKNQQTTLDVVTIESLLEDMAQTLVDSNSINAEVRQLVTQDICSRNGYTSARAFLANLGPQCDAFVRATDIHKDCCVVSPVIDNDTIEPTPSQHIHVDPYHSKFVDEYYPRNALVTPFMAYDRFEAGRQQGMYPRPEVIARLIAALGRAGEVDKVRTLYRAAQLVLSTMEHEKELQSVGWFQVEDSMIVGLAHAGDVDAAHVHHTRIIEHGGCPSADAYGALIHLVKDTTDDTYNAMALFQDSQARGVRPNIYLYNTIISKLAKARKADYALILFREMKSRHIWPTSVTYGAVIAACCRVGDAKSAEALFEEMSSRPNFRPRVPPYNTMMQFYTHTKPDRARVLYYYDALLTAKVAPTAHTYKLLLDAYGSIEPVDTEKMENIFKRVVEGRTPLVQGTHWASLINSYGCVQKNLEKALSVFDSIASHPSTQMTRAVLPDAVVFEALINVMVTLRRTDLIPLYSERLATHGIHMTAYIANLLIKGYASVGDIERSREIFESLLDPPDGIAAPHNHAPHDGESPLTAHVPATTPVYREPSTWEAMVRAELGNGNRDYAVALLDRLQARKFPLAVYNRISGIMLDDSVSPWAPSDSMSSSSA
ncbi:hypothetical protein AcV5_003654 [Taiwanofungus camphoratus]|nr:hypothetical protein AcV5_003654 [Antrodia cinnamomea]